MATRMVRVCKILLNPKRYRKLEEKKVEKVEKVEKKKWKRRREEIEEWNEEKGARTESGRDNKTAIQSDDSSSGVESGVFLLSLTVN